MAEPAQLKGKIAQQGVKSSLALLAIAAAGLVAVGLDVAPSWVPVASLSVLALAAANALFFRNPERVICGGSRDVVSPGDGRVVEVVQIEDPDGFVGKSWRIAIFLSVFNVHINRMPISGVVRGIRRSGSKFLAAFASRASDLNVQSRMDIETGSGMRFAVVQITGLIARRIVGYVQEGDTLERGERYGLICYGSRMEIYLPVDCEVRVAPGDRVHGGSSLLAEVPE
ncbi:MAG: phosphatidylserine decarboxylase family protein [bacterium]|nr:phosphatidylserine decarboxylase family protein [bacterium]